jgi:hypothetical protein
MYITRKKNAVWYVVGIQNPGKLLLGTAMKIYNLKIVPVLKRGLAMPREYL